LLNIPPKEASVIPGEDVRKACFRLGSRTLILKAHGGLPYLKAMDPNAHDCPLGVPGDDDSLSGILLTKAPAIPPLDTAASVSWHDSATGHGGVLRIRHVSRVLDLDLRVVLLDGHSVAFWLTADGRRLGWLRAATA